MRCFSGSAAMLDRINDYRRTFEGHLDRLLPFIRWEPTEKGNVRVLNETADHCRFFDAAPHPRISYECMARTTDTDSGGDSDISKLTICSGAG
jgi:hypothetical protein